MNEQCLYMYAQNEVQKERWEKKKRTLWKRTKKDPKTCIKCCFKFNFKMEFLKSTIKMSNIKICNFKITHYY